jgi:hypothetical protein
VLLLRAGRLETSRTGWITSAPAVYTVDVDNETGSLT